MSSVTQRMMLNKYQFNFTKFFRLVRQNKHEEAYNVGSRLKQFHRSTPQIDKFCRYIYQNFLQKKQFIKEEQEQTETQESEESCESLQQPVVSKPTRKTVFKIREQKNKPIKQVNVPKKQSKEKLRLNQDRSHKKSYPIINYRAEVTKLERDNSKPKLKLNNTQENFPRFSQSSKKQKQDIKILRQQNLHLITIPSIYPAEQSSQRGFYPKNLSQQKKKCLRI